jgi:hypothetical protein
MDTASAAPTLRPRLPAAPAIFSMAWQMYRERFIKFLHLYWLGFLVLLPFMVVMLLFALTKTFLPGGPTSQVTTVLLILAGVITLPVAIYFGARTQISIILMYSQPPSAATKEIFAASRQYFWSYLWLVILTGILVMLWALLFIIPAIIWGVFYSFGSLVLIYGGLKGYAALKHSRELIRGYWWAVFGREMFLGLVFMVIMIILSIPSSAIPNQGLARDFWNMITQIVNWLIGPFAGLYIYLLYRNLVTIKNQPV